MSQDAVDIHFHFVNLGGTKGVGPSQPVVIRA
jgi:hypothetical protein